MLLLDTNALLVIIDGQPVSIIQGPYGKWKISGGLHVLRMDVVRRYLQALDLPTVDILGVLQRERVPLDKESVRSAIARWRKNLSDSRKREARAGDPGQVCGPPLVAWVARVQGPEDCTRTASEIDATTSEQDS